MDWDGLGWPGLLGRKETGKARAALMVGAGDSVWPIKSNRILEILGYVGG